MPASAQNPDPAYHHEPFKGELPTGHHDRNLHYDSNASASNPVVISHTFENVAPQHGAVPGHYNSSAGVASTTSHSDPVSTSTHNSSTTSAVLTHDHSHGSHEHNHNHEQPHVPTGTNDTFTRDRREHDTIPSSTSGTGGNPLQHDRHLNDANPGPEHVTPGSTVSATSSSAASKARNTTDKVEDKVERAAGGGDGGISGPTGGAGETSADGYQYPPQLHAGKVGLGPHYMEGQGGIINKIKDKLTGSHTHETVGDEANYTRPDDGANQGLSGGKGELPAKPTTASDVRESGHAASASAGTASTKYD